MILATGILGILGLGLRATARSANWKLVALVVGVWPGALSVAGNIILFVSGTGNIILFPFFIIAARNNRNNYPSAILYISYISTTFSNALAKLNVGQVTRVIVAVNYNINSQNSKDLRKINLISNKTLMNLPDDLKTG